MNPFPWIVGVVVAAWLVVHVVETRKKRREFRESIARAQADENARQMAAEVERTKKKNQDEFQTFLFSVANMAMYTENDRDSEEIVRMIIEFMEKAGMDASPLQTMLEANEDSDA